MAKYKILVSKNQKKHTIVFTAETEKIAKDRVHKEGYSILNIEEINEGSLEGNKFYFEALVGDQVKKGKVIGNDIFKTYLKLRDSVGYRVTRMHSVNDEDLSDEKKDKIIRDLEEQYFIFKSFNKQKNTDGEKKSKVKKSKKSQNQEGSLDNFYLKKELEDTYKLVDFVLAKLKDFLERDTISGVKIEKKQKIKDIYNSIIKLRSSTNISKLKEVGEYALLKIGKLELESLEKSNSLETKELLNDTNNLLKQFGSKTQFIEKDKDYKYIISSALEGAKEFFQSLKSKEEKVEVYDKKSYGYLKKLLLLKKYKERKKENTFDILKKIHLFIIPFYTSDKKEEILIKRKVIKQNILLLKAQIQGKKVSYTSVVKGYKKVINLLFNTLESTKKYLFNVVVLYSLVFLLLLNLSHYGIIKTLSFNYDGIFYFLAFLFTYFAVYFSKGIIGLFINFVFLAFIIIFGVVNF